MPVHVFHSHRFPVGREFSLKSCYVYRLWCCIHKTFQTPSCLVTAINQKAENRFHSAVTLFNTEYIKKANQLLFLFPNTHCHTKFRDPLSRGPNVTPNSKDRQLPHWHYWRQKVAPSGITFINIHPLEQVLLRTNLGVLVCISSYSE